jgi:hypothetical protein
MIKSHPEVTSVESPTFVLRRRDRVIQAQLARISTNPDIPGEHNRTESQPFDTHAFERHKIHQRTPGTAQKSQPRCVETLVLCILHEYSLTLVPSAPLQYDRNTHSRSNLIHDSQLSNTSTGSCRLVSHIGRGPIMLKELIFGIAHFS